MRARACFSVTVAALAVAGCREPPRSEPVGPPSPACALAGLDRRAIPLALETSEGVIHCTLDGERAPRATAMVVGLAAGVAPFREAKGGAVVQRPYYTEMPFFRAIAGAMAQTGCPIGNGTGHAGYRISVEASPADAARLAKPGALFLARYTAPPDRADPAPPPPGEVIGTQLVVAVADMSHLAGKVTVLGACEDREIARRISEVVARREKRVMLHRAKVEGREGGAACPFDR